MTVEEIQSQIKKAILSGRQMALHYTDENGNQSFPTIEAITSTWSTLIRTRVIVDGQNKPRSYRYDRIGNNHNLFFCQYQPGLLRWTGIVSFYIWSL